MELWGSAQNTLKDIHCHLSLSPSSLFLSVKELRLSLSREQ